MNKKAFTLIELLVVIVIIGILASVSTATYKSYIENGNNTKKVASAVTTLDIIQAEIAQKNRFSDFDGDGYATDFNEEISQLLSDQGFQFPDFGDSCLVYGTSRVFGSPNATGSPDFNYPSTAGETYFISFEQVLPIVSGGGSGGSTVENEDDLDYFVTGNVSDTVKTALDSNSVYFFSYYDNYCEVSDSSFFGSASGLDHSIIRINPS